MEEIFRQVAEKYNLSVEEVRREMQQAIDEAWHNPHKTSEQAAFQRQIAPDGKVPTVEEVIRFLGEKRRQNSR